MAGTTKHLMISPDKRHLFTSIGHSPHSELVLKHLAQQHWSFVPLGRPFLRFSAFVPLSPEGLTFEDLVEEGSDDVLRVAEVGVVDWDGDREVKSASLSTLVSLRLSLTTQLRSSFSNRGKKAREERLTQTGRQAQKKRIKKV